MTKRLPNICDSCEHLHPVKNYGERPSCDAFPVVIPVQIWSGGFDHRAPFPDDNGILYSQRPGDTPARKLQTYEAVFGDYPRNQ